MSWLSPLKPLVVVAALGGVAYVVYIVMTAVPPEAPQGATKLEDIPNIDEMTDGVPLELPEMDIASDATPGGAAPAWTPPPAGSASNTPQGLPSSDTPISPEMPDIGAPNVELPSQTIDTTPVSSSKNFAPSTGFSQQNEFAPPTEFGVSSEVPSNDFATGGFDASPTTSPAAVAEAPQAAAFATAMLQVQQLLDQKQLAPALRQLSAIHNSTQLTPAEHAMVTELLDQVAGSVIYSREHFLLAPHVVAANETLETIAARYQVPAPLLAKINGIADPNTMQPGDQLKVVQGPFHAVVDLEKNELTLLLDDNYAGRFKIIATPGAAAVGSYVIEDKPGFHNLQLAPQAAGTPGAGAVVIGANDSRVALKLSPRDAEDVSSILSMGSNVVIRR